jgi:hypothetical protein
MALDKPKDPRRKATRFTLEAPAVLWPDAANPLSSLRTRTKNISRNGFCLHGELSNQIGAPIRFELRLPSPIGGETGCLLRGTGTLVRHEVLDDKRVGFAARIDRYTILPLPKPDAAATQSGIK